MWVCRIFYKVVHTIYAPIRTSVGVVWTGWHYYNHFTALWTLSGKTRVSRYQKSIHPLTPIVVINHPLSASSIFYDPSFREDPCSICVPTVIFGLYLLAWHPPLHTAHISSPNHCLLFAANAQTIATCSTLNGLSYNKNIFTDLSPSFSRPKIDENNVRFCRKRRRNFSRPLTDGFLHFHHVGSYIGVLGLQ